MIYGQMSGSKRDCLPRAATGIRRRTMAGIVLMIQIVDGQRAVAAHLRDILARLRPMKMMSVTRKHDPAAGGVRLQRVGIELLATTDVKDAGDDRVDSIFFVHVRHEFHARRQANAHDIRSGLRRIANQNRQPHLWRICGEGYPSDFFARDRPCSLQELERQGERPGCSALLGLEVQRLEIPQYGWNELGNCGMDVDGAL